MGDETSPGSWTTAELVRSVQRIERAQAETLAELRMQRAEFLHRDVYAADQKSFEDYKVEVAKDIINLGAEQARVRKDMLAEQVRSRETMAANLKWAIGTAIAAAAVFVAGLSFAMNALGLGA